MQPVARRRVRLVALDAFRGITIAAMILVNNPGTWNDVYPALQHAVWNGWTPTDLIFPFFLFIVGVAITLSIGAGVSPGQNRLHLCGKIVRRALLIFALGIFLNGFPRFDWSVLRIPGVLQRIAVCYFFASLIVLTVGVRAQALTAVALVAGYWVLMHFVPVPGYGAGGLEPTTNLAAYVDDTLLHGHLLHAGWDPEGVLTTLPALATTLAGVLTGVWLRSGRPHGERIAGLLVAGNLGLVLGEILDAWWPINKNLWTGSYVLLTAGMALNVLGACDWLIDFKGYRRWATPFVVFGMNPIVAYVLSSLTAKAMLLWPVGQPDGSMINLQQYVFATFFAPMATAASASLFYALAYVLLWLGITAVLYRNRAVIKI
jgi:predicted acyltransferase